MWIEQQTCRAHKSLDQGRVDRTVYTRECGKRSIDRAVWTQRCGKATVDSVDNVVRAL